MPVAYSFELEVNRAIDRGCGSAFHALIGFRTSIAGTGSLCPGNNDTFYYLHRSNFIKDDFVSSTSTYIDTDPLVGELSTFAPVTLWLINGTN
jgi:hypothetical protein